MAMVGCTVPRAGEYDGMCTLNEVEKEMPSLVCVLSCRLVTGAASCEDGYAYDYEHLQKYVRENGKRPRGSKHKVAPSPHTGERIVGGVWNEAVSEMALDAIRAKARGFDSVGKLSATLYYEGCLAGDADVVLRPAVENFVMEILPSSACPLSKAYDKKLLQRPVHCFDGWSYEEDVIMDYFDAHPGEEVRSPKTGELMLKAYNDDRTLQAAIEEAVAARLAELRLDLAFYDELRD
jgi:hypothetical protein